MVQIWAPRTFAFLEDFLKPIPGETHSCKRRLGARIPPPYSPSTSDVLWLCSFWGLSCWSSLGLEVDCNISLLSVRRKLYWIWNMLFFLPDSSLVYSLPREHWLEQNILLTTLPTLGKQWRLTFGQTWKSTKVSTGQIEFWTHKCL